MYAALERVRRQGARCKGVGRNEARQAQRRADHLGFEGAGSWHGDGWGLPSPWDQPGDVLPMDIEVRRSGSVRGAAFAQGCRHDSPQSARGRPQPHQAFGCTPSRRGRRAASHHPGGQCAADAPARRRGHHEEGRPLWRSLPGSRDRQFDKARSNGSARRAEARNGAGLGRAQPCLPEQVEVIKAWFKPRPSRRGICASPRAAPPRPARRRGAGSPRR